MIDPETARLLEKLREDVAERERELQHLRLHIATLERTEREHAKRSPTARAAEHEQQLEAHMTNIMQHYVDNPRRRSLLDMLLRRRNSAPVGTLG